MWIQVGDWTINKSEVKRVAWLKNEDGSWLAKIYFKDGYGMVVRKEHVKSLAHHFNREIE